MIRPALLAAAAVGVLTGALAARVPRQDVEGIEYREIRSGGNRYQVVRVDLTRTDLRFYWQDGDGRPFGSLAALERWLAERGDTLLAATNAGIFYGTRLPAGLHVERGRELRPLNGSSDPPPGEKQGNFFYRPNGVFFVAEDGTAHIVDTSHARAEIPRMREATQSGPLLLLNGQPHWLQGTRVSRNAVGVCAPGEVVLVYAPNGVTVRELALFIRDQLECPDALYLDGTISGLWVPSANVRRDGSYVGILGVTRRKP